LLSADDQNAATAVPAARRAAEIFLSVILAAFIVKFAFYNKKFFLEDAQLHIFFGKAHCNLKTYKNEFCFFMSTIFGLTRELVKTGCFYMRSAR